MQKTWLDSYPPGTPAEVDPDAYPSLVALFEESCRRFAGRPAYHNLGVTLTFRDLERLSGQFAAYLAGLGLARGDRVAMMMPNLLQYPIAMYGVLRAGLIVVNTNPLYTAASWRTSFSDSGAIASWRRRISPPPYSGRSPTPTSACRGYRRWRLPALAQGFR